MDSVPGSTCSSVFVLAAALPERRRTVPGLGLLVSRSAPLRRSARGHARDLSGFLTFHPIPLPGSQTPAGPAGPRPWRSCRCCPRAQHAEGSRELGSRGSTPGFGIHCLRFTSGVTATPARLASGWRAAAFAGRESNPLERDERFQVTSILLPRTSPDANWLHITMRLQHTKLTAANLPTDDPGRVTAKATIVDEVERLHWRIWNGKAKNA